MYLNNTVDNFPEGNTGIVVDDFQPPKSDRHILTVEWILGGSRGTKTIFGSEMLREAVRGAWSVWCPRSSVK